MIRFLYSLFYILLLRLFLIPTAYAADLETLIDGGRLYDKWWVDTELTPPKNNHPAYPAEGKAKAASTWRCKECHGWDYKGKDGAYRKGSHYTGIKGILDQVGNKPDDIVTVLKNKQHGFDKVLSSDALQALAAFVSEAMIDTDKYINRENKQSKANPAKGKQFFREHCRDCHGKQGQSLNLSHKDGREEFIGTIANKNPWETLHKIRFGHPGAVMGREQMHRMGGSMREHHRGMRRMWQAMPPMLDKLTIEQQVELLAYLQTLPR